MKRLLGSTLLAVFIVSCGGGGQPTITQAPGGATQQPGAATQQPAPVGGDNEAKARALAPPGSTEVSLNKVGNSVQLAVSTTQNLEQLESFYTTAIPAAGMTETGRFTVSGVLTIAVTNPDGGIVAYSNPDDGTTYITISVGTST